MLQSMKFFILLCLCALMHGCCPTCSNDGRELASWLNEKQRIRILCTTEMIADVARQIGGDRVSVLTLIIGQLDPHTYELIKGDDEKLAAAEIIFANGLGLEHGPSLHHILSTSNKAVFVGDAVYQDMPERILTIDKTIDPHIWLDASLWQNICHPICAAFESIDFEHADDYRDRRDQCVQKMEQTHDCVLDLLQQVPEQKRYLVTSHDAFNYFARAYLATEQERDDGTWKKRFAAPEGLAPEGQLGAVDIQEILAHLMLYDIHVIFPESNVGKDSIKKIVDAAGRKGFSVKVASDPLYGDAMGPKGSAADSYQGMMLSNACTIADNLKME